ncbi:uncharacterized protein LOC113759058 [Coffea eugenioides]|uniref:uncharacterized protein LOC113755661 n=1 Tax=Coffea eugenioides TaxID=49369 RepID=UPI000F5C7409|nr:uncharacterized protein LOC113728661 [Coffea arabica]XP_027155395.1 uncharacterized protein LOC113755661 [Coffea eugenioides]XP_027157471.1 uncharacterized protein LOC113759039 [Coffea eugenioides]XP_027157479.1 uncharacterized protein LOC113759058 [Coffea eugenioides]
MSTPPPLLDPFVQQQPPPMVVAAQQQAYAAHSGHGSVGPVIAVLAVISILGALAVMIGRLCSGRGVFGHGPHYDFESWVEAKCSACVDGRVDSPVPRRMLAAEHRSSSSSGDAIPVAARGVEAADQEMNQEDQETTSHHPTHNPQPHPRAEA